MGKKTIFQMLQKSKLKMTDISVGRRSNCKESSTLMAYIWIMYVVIILLHYVKIRII